MNTSNRALIFVGKLPSVNHDVKWWGRYALKRAALRQFGQLPPSLVCRTPQIVDIIRVLGFREREMDSDNLAYACKGLRDAMVQGGYLVDDAPRWATFRYRQETSRRAEGPRIEIHMWNTEGGSTDEMGW